jgi:hypothetical protein
VGQLGANAHGEVLEAGRVPDCYLALRLDPPAAESPAVLVVAPAALLHRRSRSRTAPCYMSW